MIQLIKRISGLGAQDPKKSLPPVIEEEASIYGGPSIQIAEMPLGIKK